MKKEISKNWIIVILISLFLTIIALLFFNVRMIENENEDYKRQLEERELGNFALNEVILMLENDKQVLSDSLVSLDSINALKDRKIEYYDYLIQTYFSERRSRIFSDNKVTIPMNTFKIVVHDDTLGVRSFPQ